MVCRVSSITGKYTMSVFGSWAIRLTKRGMSLLSGSGSPFGFTREYHSSGLSICSSSDMSFVFSIVFSLQLEYGKQREHQHQIGYPRDDSARGIHQYHEPEQGIDQPLAPLFQQFPQALHDYTSTP